MPLKKDMVEPFLEKGSGWPAEPGKSQVTYICLLKNAAAASSWLLRLSPKSVTIIFLMGF